MNIALYQIADQYLQDMQMLQERDLDDQTFADTLESLSGDLEIKATNVAMFIRNLEANADAIKAAEKQMADRRKAIENKAERIKEYLLQNMVRTGITKIECPFFKITVRDNPESLVIESDKNIPLEYYNQPPPPEMVLDKMKLKKDLQMGVVVDGCKLESKKRVEIK
jgi:chromatin segregation and condensation protein Rec8/ScpA/Scc1 (kleisin family)